MDDHNIYGGDENAQKGASHDLKGLMAYHMTQVGGLQYPLMCIINYMGTHFGIGIRVRIRVRVRIGFRIKVRVRFGFRVRLEFGLGLRLGFG